MKKFAERLIELRQGEGLSRSDLAGVLGVSHSAVCSWENGVCSPSIWSLIKLSEYFGVRVNYLVGLDDIV